MSQANETAVRALPEGLPPGPNPSAEHAPPELPPALTATVEEEPPALADAEGQRNALSDDERARLEAEFRAEVARDHQIRLERLNRKLEMQHASREERRERERQRQIGLLRDAVRLQFYKENGYVRIEENGRERWIPPEEHALRRGGNRPKHSRSVGAQRLPRFRWLPLYLLLALVAMALGAFLSALAV